MSTVNMSMKSRTGFSPAFLKMLQSFIVKENCVSNLQKEAQSNQWGKFLLKLEHNWKEHFCQSAQVFFAQFVPSLFNLVCETCSGRILNIQARCDGWHEEETHFYFSFEYDVTTVIISLKWMCKNFWHWVWRYNCVIICIGNAIAGAAKWQLHDFKVRKKSSCFCMHAKGTLEEAQHQQWWKYAAVDTPP